MLGLTNEYKKNKLPKFVKVYKENNIDLSIKLFCSEVRKGIFPSEEFCYVSNKKTNNNVTYIKFNEK